MANLSQMKRQRMMEFLAKLKEEHKDDDSTLIALGEIENELNGKKYGLVWEEHEEAVDIKMRTHIPVFTEDKEREITAAPGEGYNFLLEGDNLHSLRLLEKTHRGKVDVIYIDPPYNTGKNDDFIYDDKLVDTNDTFRHSKWLSFMHERLIIAERLLSKKGIIAISIGYQEVNNLTLLCEDIFSPRQVVPVTVQTSGGKPNGGFNYMQEYVIFITSTDFTPNESEENQNEYASPYHAMTLANFNQVQRPNQAYPIFVNDNGEIVGCGESLADKIKNGAYIGEKEKYTFDYSIAPEGTQPVYPVTKKGDPCVWRLIAPQLLEKWEKGYVKVTSQNKTKLNQNAYNIQYLADGIIQKIEAGEFKTVKTDPSKPTLDVIGYKTAGANIPTIWLDKSYYTTKGSNAVTEIVGRNAFSYPKPVELVKEIIRRTSADNSTILDFFAGSGTTGQAVLEINKESGGNRHFILCTNNENSICEKVTYARINTVITGLRKDGSTYSDGIPANLKYYRTDFITKDEEYLSDALLEHIAEMIQLEHGVKVDGKQYIMLLDDEEADKLAENWKDYKDVKALYISKNVLLTAQQKRLFKKTDIHIIPDYYFNFELREVGETW